MVGEVFPVVDDVSIGWGMPVLVNIRTFSVLTGSVGLTVTVMVFPVRLLTCAMSTTVAYPTGGV